jgi:hypothetical protein
MIPKPTIAVLAAASLVAAAGCGSTTKTPAPVAVKTATAPSRPAYDPKIDPSRFSAHITNAYLPWKPGTTWEYTGTKDGQPQRVVVTVTKERKTIMGVPCVVVRDLVTVNHTLNEKTVDWYAQDRAGNVWYFGEDTAEYVNGVVTSTAGTWEAGVDNAKPGIVMNARPQRGGFYRQEYRPGVAEDQARILSVSTRERVPAGAFTGVVLTRDIDPLNPDKKEIKSYARGVGPIHVIRTRSAHHEEIKLVSKRG